jgi:hypothetical protein
MPSHITAEKTDRAGAEHEVLACQTETCMAKLASDELQIIIMLSDSQVLLRDRSAEILKRESKVCV